MSRPNITPASIGAVSLTQRVTGIGSPNLVPCATRSEAQYQGAGLSDGTNTLSNSVLQHTMLFSGTSLYIAMPNAASLGVYNGGGNANAQPGTYTVNGTIEVGDQLIPVTWNGQSTYTMMAGTVAPVLSDPIPLSFSAGDVIYSHWHVVVGNPAIGTPTLTLGANSGTGGTTRYWKLTRINAAGESPASAEVSAAVGGTQTQVLTWSAAAGDLFYRLYGASSSGGQTGATQLVAEIPAGTTTYTDTGTALASGTAPGKWPAIYSISRINRGEALRLNTVAVDLTTSRHSDVIDTQGSGNWAFGPAALLSQRGTKPFVVGIGDSIMSGVSTGDSLGSFFNVAVAAAGLPLMNLGIYGEMFQDIAPSTVGALPNTAASGSGGIFYPHRAQICQAADYIVCEYATNDFQNGKTLAQVQATALLMWQWLAQYAPVYQTTCIPRPSSSSDGWTTTGGQTLPSWESIRQSWNTWIKAGAPMIAGAAVAVGTSGAVVAGQAGHPLAGYFDTNAQVEDSGTPGAWKVPGYTGDGTHPSATGHNAMANAINIALFTSTAPITTANRKASVASEQPSSVANLYAWYKPDGLSAGTITSWPDSSGNSRNAINGSSPTVLASTLNGLPVVQFANGPWLRLADTGRATPLQVFIVAKYLGTTAGATQNLIKAIAGQTILSWSTSSGGSAATNSVATSGAFTPLDGNWHIYELTLGSTPDELRVGGIVWNQTSGAGSNFTSNGYAFGAADGGGNPCNANIAEIVMFNGFAMAAIDRRRIHAYLSSKYGLSIDIG